MTNSNPVEPKATPTNLDRFSKDLDKLIAAGDRLSAAAMVHYSSQEEKNAMISSWGKEAFIKAVNEVSFVDSYQAWYSEALAIIMQLLPDRVADFRRLYERPKVRKQIDLDTYVIEDGLKNITTSIGGVRGVGTKAIINLFDQQLNILKSVTPRLTSTLFDIKQTLQADLFDSELDAARQLNKWGYTRGAGAVAGVVLEAHLKQVGENHGVTISKTAAINTANDILKDKGLLDQSQWRFIQHLMDIRNLCDHKMTTDPTRAQIDDLIAGTDKITKTVF